MLVSSCMHKVVRTYLILWGFLLQVDTGVRITFHPAIRANSNKGLMEEIGVEVLLLLGVNLQLVWDLLCQKDKDLRDIILLHVLHIHHSSTK